MLATTIQITNNPPHTTHTNNTTLLAGHAGNHHNNGGRQHSVEREPDSVSARIKHLCPTQNAPTPTTHTQGSKHMQAQENKAPTNPTESMTACLPQNWAP